MPTDRRHFLKTSTSGAALALSALSAAGQARKPNNTIQVGIIGPGDRGMQIYEYNDFRENPDTIQITFEYGRNRPKFLVSYGCCLSNGAGFGTELLGTKGTLEVEARFRVSEDGIGRQRATSPDIGVYSEKAGVQHHMANWLSAIRQRKPAAVYAPVEAGYGQSIACIMATTSYWSGRKATFDPGKREILSA